MVLKYSAQLTTSSDQTLTKATLVFSSNIVIFVIEYEPLLINDKMLHVYIKLEYINMVFMDFPMGMLELLLRNIINEDYKIYLHGATI